MATFSEHITNADLEVKESYQNKDRQTVLNEIISIIDDLNGLGINGKMFENYTADELSAKGGRLSVLQASLTPYREAAYKQVKIFEQYVEVQKSVSRMKAKKDLVEYAKAHDEKAPTADDISAKAWEYMTRPALLLGFHKTEYEKLQSYWYAIPNILFRIGQRVDVIIWKGSPTKFMNDADDVEIPEIGKQWVDYSNLD